MNRLALAAALTGFAGVALGAFGAHGLADRLDPEALGWWDTATLYALVHAVAALAIALATKASRAAGWAFIFGSVVFAGSLYAMALGAPRILGAITPIGGLAFLLGWGLLAKNALQS
jgi:uncharacterized membrane protein YgdD (TMEM256/DUF423 family)